MQNWRCTVCGYIHVGDAPPDFCPECGAPAEFFEKVSEAPEEALPGPGRPVAAAPVTRPERKFAPLGPEEKRLAEPSMFKISYGLYIVGSQAGGRLNAQCANTVVQITSDPLRVAIGINKQNFTHGLISASGVFSVGVLGQDGHDLVHHFGYQSGHQVDKMQGMEYRLGRTGSPLVAGCLAYFEGEIIPEKCIDAGTHTLFVADVVSGEVLRDEEPMTYAYYRATRTRR
ncbi:MAG: flavin reductase [Clostridia bacterium]|nr:MAG: flavin reductase [Clostridia bacterium]